MADERSRDNLIERVRKLLEKSVGRGCTQAESESAMALASRLMAEHALSMDEVEAAEMTQDERWTTEPADMLKRLNLESELAAHICADFFFVRWFYGRRWCADLNRTMTTIQFFGKPENVETARWVYSSLKASFEALWLEYRVRTFAHHTERRTFTAGIARGFTEKMRAERKAMAAEHEILNPSKVNTGTALATIGDKLAMAYKEAHPDLKNSAPSAPVRGSRDSFEAGRRAGQSLNLSRPLSGKGNKGLPGK